jgi:hypothetical protein
MVGTSRPVEFAVLNDEEVESGQAGFLLEESEEGLQRSSNRESLYRAA